ncbi:MAG: alpha/beta hydrolase [Boseongicola sp. SB0675_bin_26]|nr:alpha/beta hydrolase [Boseongicola sp. SB0675_bin_26]
MRPLVLVHGFMGGSDQWDLQAPLAEERELIAVDLPGFGRNAHMPPINTIRGFAEWVLAEVAPREFDLIGHSMGGMIVQEMMRLAPDRVCKLVLYGTGATGELPGRFETIETSMRRARTEGARHTARRIAATWFLEREAAPVYAACVAIAERAELTAIIAGLEAMRCWSGLDHLAHIAAPVLVLWGDGDRTYEWTQVETLWRTIPGANLAVVPACAHAVHFERPNHFNALLADFLDES